MKDFLSVKEFSKLSGIEATTLRYWDEIGLFSPIRRDPGNNYRYYSPEQVIAVNFITVLSSLNVPLKTIANLEHTRTPASIMELIDRQEYVLDMEMRRLHECYSILHTRRELIKRGMQADPSKIELRQMPERRLVVGADNVFPEGDPFYEPFMRFCNQADELRMNLSYPIGGLHKSFERFLANPGQPDKFFSVDPAGNAKKEAGTYLIGYVRGYYGQFDDLAQRLRDYAAQHALTPHGPLYAIYLHEEICLADPSQYLVQVCVAV